jgi:thiosulfate dehydrogenase [quinone] large subunit
MTQKQKLIIFVLRISIGWVFFYAGITKLLNPSWTAAGYLASAKTFSGFYQWLASPDLIAVVNSLNEWGLILIGTCLILGIFVRLASVFGSLIMLLYYFPILIFPKVGTNAFIIDEHIIYILVLLLLASKQAGLAWGLEGKLGRSSFFNKHPSLRRLL